MATKKKLLQAAAGNAGGAGLNVEEVFSTYLYTGNSTARSISNGIDLSGEGGLVWTKLRGPNNSTRHVWIDTVRGVEKYLESNTSDAEETQSSNSLTAFNSNGYSVGNWGSMNASGQTYASWTFRKAKKFFDVVTYTGDGTGTQNISHNLGATPGCIIVKRTDTTEDWWVYHRSIVTNDQLKLNSTAAAGVGSFRFGVDGSNFDINQSTFSVGGGSFGALDLNQNNATYVAYLFAHNNNDGTFGPDGDADAIKCGSYTGTGSAGNFVDIGFEPQWVMTKSATGSENWVIQDNMRSMTDTDYAWLRANLSSAEAGGAFSGGTAAARPTGFVINNAGNENNASGGTYIYIAIRRGTKVPESATEVFANQFGSASPQPWFKSSFSPDMALYKKVTGTGNWSIASRLTGPNDLNTNSTGAEQPNVSALFDFQNGFYASSGSTTDWMSWHWKRAPNYMDVVAYTGNGAAGRTVSHNLGVAPEMIWVKKRSSATNSDWGVYHSGLNGGANPENYYLRLNDDLAETDNATYWNDTAPTSNDFTLGTQTRVNNSGDTYIAYLFATLDGISKVGSYTGNGTNQNIDCGFSSGARFVLIKPNRSGDAWYVWDSTRGIVSGNDPFLLLNTTDAEITGADYIDPYSGGFNVTGGAGTVNRSGIEHIFYAIA